MGGDIVFFGLLGLSAILYFRGEEGSEQRKYAKYCLFGAFAIGLYSQLETRQRWREECNQGDAGSCAELDLQDLETN